MEITIWSSNSTPGYTCKKLKNLIQLYTWTSLLIASLFTIAKTWKQPNCPSTDSWFMKMWGVCVCVYICVCIYMCVCVYSMGYYSAVKNNEIYRQMDKEDVSISNI